MKPGIRRSKWPMDSGGRVPRATRVRDDLPSPCRSVGDSFAMKET